MTIKDIIKEELNSMVERISLHEESIDDFFNFLEKDPQKQTFAYAYYTYPVRMNKNIIDDNGQKIPNPMYDKIMKHSQIKFNFGDTYKEAVGRKDPDYEFGKRSGEYEKVQGYSVVETGKSGLYIPVLPLKTKSGYSVDGQPVEYTDIEKYIPKRPPYTGPVRYNQLILDRVARISAGGNVWNNPHFKYQYLGPQSETF